MRIQKILSWGLGPASGRHSFTVVEKRAGFPWSPNWIRTCISPVVYLDVLSILSLLSASQSTCTVFPRKLLFFWHVSHNPDEIITLDFGILTRKVANWIYTQFCCAQWYMFKGYNLERLKRSIFRIFEIVFSWFVVVISPLPVAC